MCAVVHAARQMPDVLERISRVLLPLTHAVDAMQKLAAGRSEGLPRRVEPLALLGDVEVRRRPGQVE